MGLVNNIFPAKDLPVAKLACYPTRSASAFELTSCRNSSERGLLIRPMCSPRPVAAARRDDEGGPTARHPSRLFRPLCLRGFQSISFAFMARGQTVTGGLQRRCCLLSVGYSTHFTHGGGLDVFALVRPGLGESVCMV